MKKLMSVLIITSLLFALIPASAFAHTADAPFVTDLTAGGGNIKSAMDVGDVKVWNDGELLYVEYVVTDGDWCITETHLEVATALEDIPQENGNPVPGRFTYEGDHDCVADVTYEIPLSWAPDTELLIAAHGVVQTGGMNGSGVTLPDQVTISTVYPGLGYGAPGYFDITVSGGTTLDGTYDGNCAELAGGPPGGMAYPYLSTESIPGGVVQKPENLDLVNWVINQGFVGKISGCGGAYTWGDVQWAIWKLVDGRQPDAGALSSLLFWSECRAQEIVDAALANGEGFVPGCGEVVVIILAPEITWTQSVIIWIPVPCAAEDETAWGGDYFGTPLEFPGDNWAIYFAYTVQ
jgi:hypothetical protein